MLILAQAPDSHNDHSEPAGDPAVRIGRPCVVDSPTGRARPLMPRPPALSSANGPWVGLHLEHHLEAAFPYQELTFPQLSLFVHTTPGVDVEYRVGHEAPVRMHPMPGDVAIIPAATTFGWSAQNTGSLLFLTFDPSYGPARAVAPPGEPPVSLRLGVRDHFVSATLTALKVDVESGFRGGRGYADALASTLCAHLAMHHADHARPTQAGRMGLSIASVRRVADFIDANLHQDLRLAALAARANLSPFHFSRMFKRSTGQSPYQFVLRRRVQRAGELLRVPGASVADVAPRVGFCDQSHLSAHFKRVFGMPPGEYARRARRH